MAGTSHAADYLRYYCGIHFLATHVAIARQRSRYRREDAAGARVLVVDDLCGQVAKSAEIRACSNNNHGQLLACKDLP
jgi:hypothetical protein